VERDSLQAVILAGGLATRLRPLTETVPKSMLLVAGKPFLEHQIALLRKSAVHNIVLCVGYLSEMIQDYFGDGSRFGVTITYSRETETLLGTGGALRNAAPFLEEEFLVTYGDSYLMLDYHHVMQVFRSSGMPGMMVVYRNEDRWDRSNVVVENSMVTFYSKTDRPPNTVYIDAGVSALRKEALRLLPHQDPVGLDILLHDLTVQGRLHAYETNQRFYEIGSLAGLNELQELLCTSGDPSIAARAAKVNG
jgi:N-acetyl-alpha-D-muramate 1-phosphate uridylyltransferase